MLFVLLLLFFVVTCTIWSVVRTRLSVRLCMVVVSWMVVFCGAFMLGRDVEASFFLSSHITWFEKYSSMLRDSAEKKDYEMLVKTIKQFDEEWKIDTQDPANIEKVMWKLLCLGPYSEGAGSFGALGSEKAENRAR